MFIPFEQNHWYNYRVGYCGCIDKIERLHVDVKREFSIKNRSFLSFRASSVTFCLKLACLEVPGTRIWYPDWISKSGLIESRISGYVLSPHAKLRADVDAESVNSHTTGNMKSIIVRGCNSSCQAKRCFVGPPASKQTYSAFSRLSSSYRFVFLSFLVIYPT